MTARPPTFGVPVLHSPSDRGTDHVPSIRTARPTERIARPMRLAHVRDRHGPSGAAWRLVGASGGTGTAGPQSWIELEVARRRAVAADPRLAHNSVLHRRPIATLDDVL